MATYRNINGQAYLGIFYTVSSHSTDSTCKKITGYGWTLDRRTDGQTDASSLNHE